MLPLPTESLARGQTRPRATSRWRRGPKMRRLTATISRGKPCPETSWKPLGQRNCGSWSPCRFGM
eukprot:15454865-Alexandrium_andersonii.AAC.1